jgi:hypothetical protein
MTVACCPSAVRVIQTSDVVLSFKASDSCCRCCEDGVKARGFKSSRTVLAVGRNIPKKQLSRHRKVGADGEAHRILDVRALTLEE